MCLLQILKQLIVHIYPNEYELNSMFRRTWQSCQGELWKFAVVKNGVTEAGLGEQEYNGSLGDGLNDYKDGKISFYSTF